MDWGGGVVAGYSRRVADGSTTERFWTEIVGCGYEVVGVRGGGEVFEVLLAWVVVVEGRWKLSDPSTGKGRGTATYIRLRGCVACEKPVRVTERARYPAYTEQRVTAEAQRPTCCSHQSDSIRSAAGRLIEVMYVCRLYLSHNGRGSQTCFCDPSKYWVFFVIDVP